MAKHIWEDSFSCGINKQVRKDLQKAAKDVRQKKKGATEMSKQDTEDAIYRLAALIENGELIAGTDPVGFLNIVANKIGKLTARAEKAEAEAKEQHDRAVNIAHEGLRMAKVADQRIVDLQAIVKGLESDVRRLRGYLSMTDEAPQDKPVTMLPEAKGELEQVEAKSALTLNDMLEHEEPCPKCQKDGE